MSFFFMSALGNISVYAVVIFITLSVLIIFGNISFLNTSTARKTRYSNANTPEY